MYETKLCSLPLPEVEPIFLEPYEEFFEYGNMKDCRYESSSGEFSPDGLKPIMISQAMVIPMTFIYHLYSSIIENDICSSY